MIGIVAGIHKDSGLVKLINEVPSGKVCDCVCAECGTPLVARKGKIKAHHFAHLGDARAANPRTCYETALHVAAKHFVAQQLGQLHVPEKRLLEESESRYLPDTGESFSPSIDVLVSPERMVERASGEVEPSLGTLTAFRPDALIQTSDVDTLYIEIHVTNSPDERKRQALRACGLDVLELDLSDFREEEASLEALEGWIREAAPRRWLSFPLSAEHEKALTEYREDVASLDRIQEQSFWNHLKLASQASLSHVQNGKLRLASIQCKGTWMDIDMKVPVTLKQQGAYVLGQCFGLEPVPVWVDPYDRALDLMVKWYQNPANGRRGPLTYAVIETFEGEREPVVHLRLAADRQVDAAMLRLVNLKARSQDYAVDALYVESGREGYYKPLASPLTKAVLSSLNERVLELSYSSIEFRRSLLRRRLADIIVDVSGSNATINVHESVLANVLALQPDNGFEGRFIEAAQSHDLAGVELLSEWRRGGESLRLDGTPLIHIEEPGPAVAFPKPVGRVPIVFDRNKMARGLRRCVYFDEKKQPRAGVWYLTMTRELSAELEQVDWTPLVVEQLTRIGRVPSMARPVIDRIGRLVPGIAPAFLAWLRSHADRSTCRAANGHAVMAIGPVSIPITIEDQARLLFSLPLSEPPVEMKMVAEKSVAGQLADYASTNGTLINDLLKNRHEELLAACRVVIRQEADIVDSLDKRLPWEEQDRLEAREDALVYRFLDQEAEFTLDQPWLLRSSATAPITVHLKYRVTDLGAVRASYHCWRGTVTESVVREAVLSIFVPDEQERKGLLVAWAEATHVELGDDVTLTWGEVTLPVRVVGRASDADLEADDLSVLRRVGSGGLIQFSVDSMDYLMVESTLQSWLADQRE